MPTSYPTRSPGPYTLSRDEIPVPPAVEQLSAEIYREAYRRGWFDFGNEVDGEKQLDARIEEASAVATRPHTSSEATRRRQELETEKAKGLKVLHDIEEGIVTDVEKSRYGDRLPGYEELCARITAVYRSAYAAGWEANALAYIQQERLKKKSAGGGP